MALFGRRNKEGNWEEEETTEEEHLNSIFSNPESYTPKEEYWDKEVKQIEAEDQKRRHKR